MSELDTVQFNDDTSEDDISEMKILNILPDLNMKQIKYTSSDILLEALINQVCKYVEKNPKRQERLYFIICDKLNELHLLGETYKIVELQYLREKYMNILQKMIQAAKYLTDVDIPNSDGSPPNLEPMEHLQQFRGKIFDWSRYAHEFREFDFIARGGFGQVYKAHNKLDDCAYAIKKICLKYHNVDSFIRSLREVQTLAKLNHPNIVAYKAAWLEPFDSRKHTIRTNTRIEPPKIELLLERRIPKTELQIIEELKNESQPKLTSNSFEIEFKDSSASDSLVQFKNSDSSNKSSSQKLRHNNSQSLDMSNKNYYSEKNDGSSPLGLNLLYSQDSIENEIVKRRNQLEGGSGDYKNMSIEAFNTQQNKQFSYFFPESQTMSMDWVTLYIQMQLCEITLKEWLSNRSYDVEDNYDSQVFYILKQIVQGIEYIHSNSIVHHDIKPSNIFVSHDLKSVQVGDFGLACSLITHSQQSGHSVITTPSRAEHPLGTRLYAAPEQLHGMCDPKSDVYSLGIVLFEMLINFSTDMEKSKEITKLKMGQMSPLVSNKYPHYAKIITKLLDVNPKHRPSASQVLLYLESITDSKKLVPKNEKDKIIDRLKQEIISKTEQITLLQQKIEQLELKPS